MPMVREEDEEPRLISKSVQKRLVHQTFVIMRSPCVMEDEGRHFFIKTCSTREEAEQWIAAQKDAYFKPFDYYIAEKN